MALRATARGATSSLPSKERDDLQEELKQKAALLSSVQRNYEAISRLMQEKSNDMATVRSGSKHRSKPDCLQSPFDVFGVNRPSPQLQPRASYLH